MADLRAWSPLGPEHAFTPRRRVRRLGVDWKQAPPVLFAASARLGLEPASAGLPPADGRPDGSTALRDAPRAANGPRAPPGPWASPPGPGPGPEHALGPGPLGDSSTGPSVVPVMPFVRANGGLGLMPLTPRGFGLADHDVFPPAPAPGPASPPWNSAAPDAPWNSALVAAPAAAPSLFRVLHTHDLAARERIRPRGLFNTRNMCFFNSVLQVLVHTSPLYALIDEIVHRVPLRPDHGATPVLDAVSQFFYHYRHHGDGRRAISGEEFYNVICALPQFHVERNRQEDAQEFMSDLLDGLETTFRDAPPTAEDRRDNLLDAKRRAQARAGEDDAAAAGWTEVGQNNRKVETQHAGRQDRENPIEELFGGRFRSTLVKPGGKPSVTTEPFQQIMLDISEPGVTSVQRAFTNLLTEEHLTLDNAHATKRSELELLPPILIVHIKRFTFIQTHGEYEMGKITKPVVVDEVLRLNCVGKGELTYRPVGVIYHHGTSATRGHYTADVNVNNQWYKIDDEQVVPVDANEVVGHDSVNGGGSRSAYMVFYESY